MCGITNPQQRVSITFFEKEFCPQCGPAKQVLLDVIKQLDAISVEVEFVNADTEEGMLRALMHMIDATPGIVVNGLTIVRGEVPTPGMLLEAIKRAALLQSAEYQRQ